MNKLNNKRIMYIPGKRFLIMKHTCIHIVIIINLTLRGLMSHTCDI